MRGASGGGAGGGGPRSHGSVPGLGLLQELRVGVQVGPRVYAAIRRPRCLQQQVPGRAVWMQEHREGTGTRHVPVWVQQLLAPAPGLHTQGWPGCAQAPGRAAVAVCGH